MPHGIPMNLRLKNGRLRTGATIVALLTVLPLALVAVAPTAAAGVTACGPLGSGLAASVNAGVLTPGKVTSALRNLPVGSGLLIAIETSGAATWAVKDATTGETWLTGATTAETPAVEFTQPTPFGSLCLEITNVDALPITFGYSIVKLS